MTDWNTPITFDSSWTIVRKNRPWYSMPYVVLDPQGFVVAARATLRGAKRALRRENRRRQSRESNPDVVVYSEPDNL